MKPLPPHQLTVKQKEVLLHLLRHDLPEFDVLRGQLAHATVTKYWSDPSASFDVEVLGGVPASLQDGMYADAEWGWTPGGEPEGNLIVWVADGLISAVEYAVVADDYPDELPDVGRIREPSLAESGSVPAEGGCGWRSPAVHGFLGRWWGSPRR